MEQPCAGCDELRSIGFPLHRRAGSVQFVVVKDDELLELPSGQQQLAKLPAAERAEVEGRRAAIALRRLLRSHRKEQVGGGAV